MKYYVIVIHHPNGSATIQTKAEDRLDEEYREAISEECGKRCSTVLITTDGNTDIIIDEFQNRAEASVFVWMLRKKSACKFMKGATA